MSGSGIIQNFFDTFWSESVWLPPNTTWADIAPGSRPGVNHANYRHLFYPLPMALVMLGIRYLLERYTRIITTPNNYYITLYCS